MKISLKQLEEMKFVKFDVNLHFEEPKDVEDVLTALYESEDQSCQIIKTFLHVINTEAKKQGIIIDPPQINAA